MRNVLMLLLSLSLLSCETTSYTAPPKPELNLVETPKPPPPSPGQVVPIPADLTPEEKAVLSGLGVPLDGYVFSESKAEGAAALRVYAESAWSDSENNRNMCQHHTDVWWERLVDLDAQNHELLTERNSWWSRNKDSVFFGSGIVLGAATTVLIVFGLNQSDR